MRKILAAGIVLAVVVPAGAAAKSPTRQHARVYQRDYHAVARQFGRRAPGRNIIRDGLAIGAATDRDVVRSIGVLERMLTPPRVGVPTHAVAYTPAAPASSFAGSSAGLPACTWVPESGGNWRAVNPSSGAGGRYQILPSTWAAYGGTGAPQDASPAQQTAIATKIYAGGAGASQWVNC